MSMALNNNHSLIRNQERALTRKPTKQFEKHITQVKVNPNNIGGVMVNVLEGRITCFSHYYGVLTPLNQWWKNL